MAVRDSSNQAVPMPCADRVRYLLTAGHELRPASSARRPTSSGAKTEVRSRGGGSFTGDRVNDIHLANAVKLGSRKTAPTIGDSR
jgi:hypothetical protein